MIIHHTPQRQPIGSSVSNVDQKVITINPILNDYLKTTKTDIQKHRIIATLDKVQGFSGVYSSRLKWALDNYKAVQIDHDAKRIYLKTDKIADGYSFYEFKDITKTLIDFIFWLQFNR